MGIPGGMNVRHHNLPRGLWEQEPPPTSLTLGCKRLRSLAPKPTAASAAGSDIKSFIFRSEGGARKDGPPPPVDVPKNESAQVEAQPGPGPGTRWNPTQEQIGILETLYKGGMRTPSALQIEHIATKLNKYGKVEGKNVFYWFQNHKARERQKQKRMTLGLIPKAPCNSGTSMATTCMALSTAMQGGEEHRSNKRRGWGLDEESKVCDEERRVEDRTLQLFPLHPELGASLRGF